MLVEGWGQERLRLIALLVLLTTTPHTITEPSAIGAILSLAVLAQGTSSGLVVGPYFHLPTCATTSQLNASGESRWVWACIPLLTPILPPDT